MSEAPPASSLSEPTTEDTPTTVESTTPTTTTNNTNFELSELMAKQPNEMSREELVHLATLYQQEKQGSQTQKKRKEKKKLKNEMDWNTQPFQHIALKVAYVGFNYQGLARQVHTANTIEHHLFEVLKKLKLIESEEKSEYTRCGRTDKGVSALCQVVSFYLRASKDPKRPFDYVRMMNNKLPDDIRVLAWCPVTKDFDARFGCIQRTYKYFFIKQNLDIEKMKQGAAHFLGEHDFRNFCKINAEDVSNFRRKILNIEIVKSDLFHQQYGGDESYDIYEIIVFGYSFLWHQIRCMAAILFLIGEGKEDPSVIKALLDIENNKARPQYVIASEYPLVLFDCVFEDLKWVHVDTSMDGPANLVSHFFDMWRNSAMKSTMLNIFYRASNNILVDMTKVDPKSTDLLPVKEALKIRPPKERGPKYVRLLERAKGLSYEECLESLQKKRKQ